MSPWSHKKEKKHTQKKMKACTNSFTHTWWKSEIKNHISFCASFGAKTNFIPCYFCFVKVSYLVTSLVFNYAKTGQSHPPKPGNFMDNFTNWTLMQFPTSSNGQKHACGCVEPGGIPIWYPPGITIILLIKEWPCEFLCQVKPWGGGIPKITNCLRPQGNASELTNYHG